jgi:hypothetical protein
VTARRYQVRLFEWSTSRGRTETNFDPTTDAVLREQLEARVKATKGTLDLDLSCWWIRVRTMSGHKIAECRVTSTGATAVKRW